MSDEWVGIIHTTRPKYMKGASDLTLRKRLLLQMLRKKGRIERNASGDECKWQVEYSQPPITSYGGSGQLAFSNHNAHQQATLDWRGYIATDTLTKKQNAMNSGQEALINLFQTKSNRLVKSLGQNFAREIVTADGNASGSENRIHGIASFEGYTDGESLVTDRLAYPVDTYGGLSTTPGAGGGSWSTNLTTKPNHNVATDWPDGQGDSEYDYWTPKLINWSSSGWGTGSVLWEDNCWRVIGQAITWLTTTGDLEGMPDICLLAPDLFQGYKNHEETIRRITVPHKESQDLGFGNVLNQDGVAIQADYDIPSTKGFMLNVDKMTLRSIMPELFWMEGPDKDPRNAWAWLWGVGFYGNLFVDSPKHFAVLDNYKAA